MRTHRRWYLPAFAVLITLAGGVGIGGMLTLGVHPPHLQSLLIPAGKTALPSPAELSNAFARVADEVEPAVVNITTQTTVQIPRHPFGAPGDQQFGDFFKHFFDYQNRGRNRGNYQRRSLGSGIILDPRGYVLTNYHVVMQTQSDKPVDRIEVYLQGDSATKYRARIVGADKWTDLAVIKIESDKPLAAARFGDSASARVGDWVLAIGSPFGLQSTVTAGIISAKGRDIEPGSEGQFKRFIQTDAAINPGNSGGPLVNLAGQVIGINTAIATDRGSNDGIGFAIPSDTARGVYNAIVSTGRVSRGAIGVTFWARNNPALLHSFGASHGVVVNSVERGSPAERAGLKRGDVILAIEGQQIQSGDELVQIVSNRKIGSKITLGVLRDGKHLRVPVQVGDRSKIVAEQVAENRPPATPKAPRKPGEMLGMKVQDLTPDQAGKLNRALRLKTSRGVLITDVAPEGFAAGLSVSRGDVLLALNHHAITSAAEFKRIEAALRPGKDTLLLIARRSGATFTTLYLADRLP